MLREEIKNPYYLIVGDKYQIEHPCYDDYDEGLLPEIEVVEVIKKLNTGYIFKSEVLEYHITFYSLMDCKIHKLNETILED